MDTSDCLTEEYRSLDDKVVERLEDIFKSGEVSFIVGYTISGFYLFVNLSSRQADILGPGLPDPGHTEGAASRRGPEVLRQFVESNLEHVSNKSAYLCGVMKTYWQKTKPLNSTKGPDEEKIEVFICVWMYHLLVLQAILKRTGYTLDVTSGQRKYGGPPPNWGDRGGPWLWLRGTVHRTI
ncbi:HNRNPR [Cordylochernes scorpioides]|uniref:HNRNPR n=1 Tax=Cordylochernes scorpioides TaxID=51811 RepID=A0ABY6JYB6_9ARAC|nr:HNRNPR [Cordylochernes scorpioides]